MDESNKLIVALVFIGASLGFLLGMLWGILDYDRIYKQGQLDFQRGKIEWLLVGPDEVHHVLKEKE
jgi:hypothetical protein